jgi:hypothetical protein
MSPRSSLLLYMTASPRLVPYAHQALKRLATALRPDGLSIAVELDARGRKKPVRYRIDGRRRRGRISRVARCATSSSGASRGRGRRGARW